MVSYPGIRVGPESTFEPIPEMMRKDADIAIMRVLKHSTNFFRPVDDLLFSAHQKTAILTLNGEAIRYWADDPQSLIGCTDQVLLISLL